MKFSIRKFYRSLDAHDRLILGIVLVAVIVLTNIPYVVGPATAGKDYRYLGLYPMGPADTNVYFSFMKQAAQGHVFIENLHTSEPQDGSIFHPLWLVLGWIAGLFRLSIPVVFHVARVVAGVFFLLVAYAFIGEAFNDRRRRIIALVLLAFASGVGTFFSIGISGSNPTQILLLWPADQWVTESNTFMTLMHSPLFILSQLLLLMIFWLNLRDDRRTPIWYLGTLVALLALLHPYDMVTVFAVLGIWELARAFSGGHRLSALTSGVRRLFLLSLFAIPPLAYYYLVGKIEPAIGLWSKQNITLSPPVHNYILGYGLLLAFAIVGIVAVRRNNTTTFRFPIVWLLAGLVLLYVPVQINRRFTNGLHLPLVLLATTGIDLLWRWLESRFPNRELLRHAMLALAGWILGFGLFFSTITGIARAIYYEADPAQSLYHIRASAAAAMDWLEQNAPARSVVLSHSFTGNILPARTGLRVYLGHGHQTVNYGEKGWKVTKWFYWTNGDDGAKEEFLRVNNIRYVYYGPDEKGKGRFRPDEKEYLRLVFVRGDDRVYEVVSLSERD
ncbi:MAG: hypothetical protein HY566_02255 [Candidatus Kerfeldbacteria bacterium]|nr:hypothetical protein [Candidatus Kerfeldbacteria bacterium]